jgi:citrate lyase subunit beta-like protein
VQDLQYVSREIYTSFQSESFRNPAESPLHIVASIESARSVWNLGDIAAWKSEHGPELGGTLSALLVYIPLHLHSLSCSTANLPKFASEDCKYSPSFLFIETMFKSCIVDCADTSIIRTPSRQELLYTRSQIVVAAKTFGLNAIDMVSDERISLSFTLSNHMSQVCINYKDLDYLRDECEDGRRLGFNGKVLIFTTTVQNYVERCTHP